MLISSRESADDSVLVQLLYGERQVEGKISHPIVECLSQAFKVIMQTHALLFQKPRIEPTEKIG
jgi:hypothetical protein